jgi:hypothetical protein
MMYFKWEVRESTIPGAGLGLFTRETIHKGDLVARWDRIKVLAEEDWQQLVGAGHEVYRVTGCRWSWSQFCVKPIEEWELGTKPESFINHSEDANLFHILGNFIAFTDIHPGEELLENYRYGVPDVDSDGNRLVIFVDGRTGRDVRGYSRDSSMWSTWRMFQMACWGD